MADEDNDKKEQSKKQKKTPQEEFEDAVYKRRCELVRLSKSSDFTRFMSYLRENERTFSKMEQADKECMRRTCQRAIDNSSSSTSEDIEYCDRVFGRFIEASRSMTANGIDQHEYKEPKMTLEEEIAYRSRGSYYAMWDFISNPEWQRKLKGRTDLYDKVKFMIDRAKKENYAVTSSMKRYDPSDEETFRKVLESMR